MKTIVVVLALVGMGAILAGCGGDEPKSPAKSGTAAGDTGTATTGANGDGSASETGDATDSDVAGDVIPEMKDFINSMNGDAEVSDAAREKYTAEGVITDVMKTIAVREPQIIKTEKEDDVVAYTLKTRAGISTQTFQIYWKDGKIIRIDRLEMTFD
jgi:hypothetical protein